MELIEAIRGRRAVRDYTSQPVSEEQLRGLIAAAVQAPTAMHREPWGFSVIRDRALLERISTEAKMYMLHSSPAGLASHHFEQLLKNPAFDIFYHAPALILISAIEHGAWSQIDCALAAENLMLAAYGTGLGSCWIGFAQAWLGTPTGKAAIGLPDGWTPVAPIIVGYPKAPTPATPRRDPEIRWID